MEDNGFMEPEQVPMEMPETFLTPVPAPGSVQVHKVNTQVGEVTLVKVYTPAHTYTLKLDAERARELATALTGGIEIARPGLVKLRA